MSIAAVASPPRRSVRSHEAVLAAAADIAGRRGYGNTRIEDIAAQAGVGKQTIYRWWPNRAALLIEVYGRLVPPDVGAADTGSLAGDLESLLSRLSALYADTPAGNILSGLIAEAQADAELARQLRDTYVAPRRSIVRSILQRATDRGEIDPPDNTDFVSDLFSGAVWFQLLLGTRSLDREFRRRLVDAVLCTIRSACRVGQPPDRKKRT
jgi:AcrR family transcriptional regulator